VERDRRWPCRQWTMGSPQAPQGSRGHFVGPTHASGFASGRSRVRVCPLHLWTHACATAACRRVPPMSSELMPCMPHDRVTLSFPVRTQHRYARDSA